MEASGRSFDSATLVDALFSEPPSPMDAAPSSGVCAAPPFAGSSRAPSTFARRSCSARIEARTSLRVVALLRPADLPPPSPSVFAESSAFLPASPEALPWPPSSTLPAPG